MKRVIELRKRLQGLNVDAELNKAITEAKQPMIDKNREQLTAGRSTADTQIGTYSPRYAQTRKKRGLQTAFVDLKVTGALYRAIDIFITKTQTIFFSRVEYAQYLEDRYAQDKKSHIFGLTDKNLQEVSKVYIMPKLIQTIKEKIFK